MTSERHRGLHDRGEELHPVRPCAGRWLAPPPRRAPVPRARHRRGRRRGSARGARGALAVGSRDPPRRARADEGDLRSRGAHHRAEAPSPAPPARRGCRRRPLPRFGHRYPRRPPRRRAPRVTSRGRALGPLPRATAPRRMQPERAARSCGAASSTRASSRSASRAGLPRLVGEPSAPRLPLQRPDGPPRGPGLAQLRPLVLRPRRPARSRGQRRAVERPRATDPARRRSRSPSAGEPLRMFHFAGFEPEHRHPPGAYEWPFRRFHEALGPAAPSRVDIAARAGSRAALPRLPRQAVRGRVRGVPAGSPTATRRTAAGRTLGTWERRAYRELLLAAEARGGATSPTRSTRARSSEFERMLDATPRSTGLLSRPRWPGSRTCRLARPVAPGDRWINCAPRSRSPVRSPAGRPGGATPGCRTPSPADRTRLEYPAGGRRTRRPARPSPHDRCSCSSPAERASSARTPSTACSSAGPRCASSTTSTRRCTPGGVRPAHLARDAELIEADVRDLDAMRAAVRGVTHVVHLAAETSVGQSMYQSDHHIDVNVRGTAVLFRALREEGVGRRPRGHQLVPGRLRRGCAPLRSLRHGASRAATGGRPRGGGVGASLPGLRGPSRAGGHDGGRAAAVLLRLRDDQALPGAGEQGGGGPAGHPPRRPALLQRLRPPPVAGQSVHRPDHDLRPPAARREAPGPLRGGHAGAGLRPRRRRRARRAFARCWAPSPPSGP